MTINKTFTLGLGLGHPHQSWQIQLCGWPDRLALRGPWLGVYSRQRKSPPEREARRREEEPRGSNRGREIERPQDLDHRPAG